MGSDNALSPAETLVNGRMHSIVSGFRWLQQDLDSAQQQSLLGAVRKVITLAPLFQPRMPKTGKPFGVRMTNCGPLGWVSDQARGYRYQATHPVTQEPWPPIPPEITAVWDRLAEFHAPPEACLINYYDLGRKMGSHVDRDEQTFDAPVVSISLGDTATFHIGGLKRNDPKQRIQLRSGDVAVMGGASRLCFHGIDRVLAGTSALLPEGGRINLTLRRVTAC